MARSRKNHEIHRDKLVHIALDLFIEKGYESATVTDIMHAAGLSKGGMYHYFSSKEEILDAVIQFGLRQEVERLEAKLMQLPFEEKLPYFAQNTSIGAFSEKLIGFSQANRDSIVGYRMREYNLYYCIPILRKIFEEGIANGLFRTQCPHEMAEFCALLVRAIVDSNFLPPTNADGAQRRVDAFMQIMGAGLEIEASYAQRLAHLFDRQVQQIQEADHERKAKREGADKA